MGKVPANAQMMANPYSKQITSSPWVMQKIESTFPPGETRSFHGIQGRSKDAAEKG
jgi:hypothetical protein